jgi:hypothetical protein
MVLVIKTKTPARRRRDHTVASVQARVIGCEVKVEKINHGEGPGRWSRRIPVTGTSCEEKRQKARASVLISWSRAGKIGATLGG